MATYPLQVLFKKIDISITPYVMAICICAYIAIVFKNKKLLFDKKFSLLFFLLIGTFFISFIFNIEYLRFYDTYILRKYISYLIWLLMVISLGKYICLDEHKKLMKFTLLLLGTINFLAAIAQSLLKRYPILTEIKPWNLVGVYARAGSVYADSNFLAMYFVILFYSILALIRQRSLIKNFILFLLFTSILLTFSRGALLFFLLSFFIYNYRTLTGKKTKIIYILLTLVFSLAGISLILYLEPMLLNRFTSEMGRASFFARIRQYNLLLRHLIEFPETLCFGLGPGVFKGLYVEEIHNFFFSLFGEVGIIGPLIVIALLIYFNKKNNNVAIGSLLLFWLLEGANLPAIPNALFIIFALIIVAPPNRSPHVRMSCPMNNLIGSKKLPQ